MDKARKSCLVLDASALISSPVTFEGYTVKEIIEEVKSFPASTRVLPQKIQVMEPRPELVKKVENATKQTGDRLSVADTKLIALALELSEEGKDPVITTDDFSIQNVAAFLGLNYRPVLTQGIKEAIKWIWICPTCNRSYPVSYTHLTLPTTERV